MKTVHFLISRSTIIDYLISPVVYNQKALKDRGYKTRFSFKLTPSFMKCDILVILSKPFFKLMKEHMQLVITEPNPIIDLLKEAKNRANKVIWMDTSDSTTVTHFELLPYVDLYLKKQLFHDMSLYKKEFYGGRIFSDFYHREFGIEDSALFEQFYPLENKYADKVDLSWNIGIGDTYNAFSRKTRFRILYPQYWPASYKVNYVSPESERPLDIFLRTSTNYNRESVVFHRKELLRRLEEMLENNEDLTGSVRGWVTDKVYKESMAGCKIAFGPFGWGELNIREYEALANGSLLLRPDISYMHTWPNIFIDQKTCVFYDWDFANLGDLILEYKGNAEKRLEIARNGQEALRQLISDKGMSQFCDWFVQQIEK